MATWHRDAGRSAKRLRQLAAAGRPPAPPERPADRVRLAATRGHALSGKPQEFQEIDVWRTAHVLMKEYGEEATLIAARRSDALLEQGDTLGCSVWLKIIKAIEDLKREQPREGEAVN